MRRLHTYISILLVLCALPMTGCEEDVTAVLGTDQPFSLFGVVSPELDSQWVRVFPVEDILAPASGARLDAHFVSIDLETGEEHVWRDSLIQDALRQQAHVFWAPFRAEYDRSYRLTVGRSSGDESSVEVTVPPRTEVVVQPPEVISTSVRLPVLIEGDAPRLLRIEAVYAVSFRPAGSLQSIGEDISISYDGLQQRTPEGWLIRIDLSDDYRRISQELPELIQYPIDRTFGIVLINITLRLIVANEEWNPPGGVFDVNSLIQPDVMSNVRNGFGFVGAGYRHEKTWVPPRDVVEAAGFRSQTE